jgi:hypothetical protein
MGSKKISKQKTPLKGVVALCGRTCYIFFIFKKIFLFIKIQNCFLFKFIIKKNPG